jgi:hypothetical protein
MPMLKTWTPAAAFSIVLVLAALAAAGVWVFGVATFNPGPYVDNRPYCSNGYRIPYTVDGVLVEPTASPACYGSPIPAEARNPSPTPAVATFVFVLSLGLIVEARRERHASRFIKKDIEDN